MKDDDVIRLLDAALTGHSSLVTALQNWINQSDSKRENTLRRRLQQMLERRSVRQAEVAQALTGDAAKFFHIPQKKLSLDELFLTDLVRRGARDIICEYRFADKLAKCGFAPTSRLLLTGPAGNGKTSLAVALGNALELPVYILIPEVVIGSYLGETAANLSKALQAVSAQRCLLFVDEIDAFARSRAEQNDVSEIKRVVNTLLMAMDRLPQHVFLVGATNMPDCIDAAVTRRFETQFWLGCPIEEKREAYIHSLYRRHNMGDAPIADILAELGKEASYAQIEHLCIRNMRQQLLAE